MNAAISRAAALAKQKLRLTPGAQLNELILAAERAQSVDELPSWAVAVIQDGSLTKRARDLHPESLDWYHGWVPRTARAWRELAADRTREPERREYVPGQWIREPDDHDIRVAKAVDSFLAEVERSEPDRAIDDDDMARIRKYFEDAEPRSTRTRHIVNGPHRVTYNADDLSDTDVRRLTVLLDRLQAIVPVDAMNVHVRDWGYVTPNPETVLGQTRRGTGHIEIRPRAFRDWPVHPGLSREVGEHHMPVARMVDQLTYVITHEWGHAIDHWDNAQVIEMWGAAMRAGERQTGDMSDYGELSPRESLAEAFTELVLSRGETRNRSALTYLPTFEVFDNWGEWGDDTWD